jgi:phosphatidylinositol glycan class A protein
LLVVSTNVGGVPEVLPPDTNVLCNPNVNALVEGLQKAVKRQEESSEDAVDPMEAHCRIESMYSWHLVAKQTVQVYDRIVTEPPKTFMERLACYQSLRGFSGVVACILAVYIEIWIRVGEWMQPRDKIEVVPDLMIIPFDDQQKDKLS